MRGNVVIKETSKKKFRQQEKEILDQLTVSGISPTVLKFFYVSVKPDSYEESIELWLLP